MSATPLRMSGVAAFLASLGLHAAALGLVVAGTLSLPESAAATWSGGTFEVSMISEMETRGAVTDARSAEEAGQSGSTSNPEESQEHAAPSRTTGGEAAAVPPAASAAVPTPEPSGNANVPNQERTSRRAPGDANDARGSSRGAGKAEPVPTPEHTGAGAVGAEARAEETSAPASGAYGAASAEMRKGSLPDAFTRALPMAARGAAWRALPTGPAGRFIVVVGLDDEGAVDRLTPLGSAPAHVLELARSLQLLLRAGRFAAPPEGGVSGYRLGVSAHVDQVAPSSDESASPELVRELSFQKLAADKPGVATLVYNSGRRVRFEVVVDPKWPEP